MDELRSLKVRDIFMISQCHGAWISWQDITSLNRRIGIQYLVVAPKELTETEILAFIYAGKGIFM